MPFTDILQQELEHLRQAGLYRSLTTAGSPCGRTIEVEGRQLILMASNDYLGLCQRPRMIDRTIEAVKQWGTGSGAARLISGNLLPFTHLEQRLAACKGTQSALVFSTGYMANAGILTALAGPDDCIYSDQLNHASIIDGCRLSPAHCAIYPHCDCAALEQQLAAGSGYRRRLIVTDGVFSMNGAIAPLPRLLELARQHDAWLVVDDAHATGVLGAQGGGTCSHWDLQPEERMVIMGTLGKALGSFGAFVAGPAAVRELLINRARSFIFTTALPPATVAAADEALAIIAEEPQLLARLRANISALRSRLRDAGFQVPDGVTPIVPITVGDPQRTLDFSRQVRDNGLFAVAIRPPTVPVGHACLRLTVSAAHTPEDIEHAIDALTRAARSCGLR